MIVDITNEVYTNIKNTMPDIEVMQGYSSLTPSFPCVVVDEISNIALMGSKDSAGNHHSEISLEINIFTNSENKISEAKSIRNRIDFILSENYCMNREYSGTIPNYLDNNIYRYVLRYSCIVGANKVIYGR